MACKIEDGAMCGSVRPMLEEVNAINKVGEGRFNFGGIQRKEMVIMGCKQVDAWGGEVKILTYIFYKSWVTLPSRFVNGRAMVDVVIRADERYIFPAEHVKGIFALAWAIKVEMDEAWGGEV